MRGVHSLPKLRDGTVAPAPWVCCVLTCRLLMRFQLVLMLLLLTSAHQRRFQTSATPQQRQKLYGDDNADDDDAGAADVPMSEFLRRMTALRRNTTDLGEGQVAVAIRVAELLRAASDAKISHAALAELR
eukprot:COSAG02_NODE_33109_length_505_cov_0.901478_1_plen_129_part_01